MLANFLTEIFKHNVHYLCLYIYKNEIVRVRNRPTSQFFCLQIKRKHKACIHENKPTLKWYGGGQDGSHR